MLCVGGSDGAHALLAGATGCGKSSLLHTIINAIVMRYCPNDVQIWLSDYKSNEFKRYMQNTPAHIKYVATDRSMEYTLHFLDKIYAEYQRRIDLFGSITSVKEYRDVHGQGSMPRILIIVDEFHVMSNHIKEEPAYKSKLASILREARSVGVTLFLSDQTCGTGLQGLSEDGKKQLTCRLAMMTQMDEYNAVFNISNSKDVIPAVQPYEIILQRFRKQEDKYGKIENKVYYEHDKTIFIDNSTRNLLAEKSIVSYGPASDPIFFISEKRSKFDWNQISERHKTQIQNRTTPLYLGTPADLNKVMTVSMVPGYGENLMSVGANLRLQSELIYYAIESIKRGDASYRIFIMAEEYDLLYIQCKDYLDNLPAGDGNIQIINKEEEICRTVIFFLEELENRRKKRSQAEKLFVFWLGLDDLSRELAHYSEQRPDLPYIKNDRPVKPGGDMDQDRLDKLFGELFADADVTDTVRIQCSEAADDDSDEFVGIYNANNDISELMKEGAKKSIHNLVFFTSVASIKRARCISRIYGEEFRHKIAFRMSKDDAVEYLGRSSLVLTPGGELLDEETAVYYDGLADRRFSPFKGPVEEQYE